jgi:hypothetical protein
MTDTLPSRAERSAVAEMTAPERGEDDNASSASTSETGSDEPREARKGWWQRRFKI